MQEKIIIGKIVAPHGVRGDIRILPMTETPELFLDTDYLLVEGFGKLTVTRARFQKNMVLVSSEEIRDMNGAEALRNRPVALWTEDLPELDEGRFYVKDLVGFECVDEAGRPIGSFEDTMQTGSVDVFVIKGTDGKEILVAATGDNILKIDTAQRRMVIHLPEWADED